MPTADDTAAPFWREHPLERLGRAQWESLCDGCARCCLHKLVDADGELHYTAVACRLLDRQSCRCTDYAHRRERVPDCMVLDAAEPQSLRLLPPTCAYRLLAEGAELPAWHPLVSGDPESVHRAGVSVRGNCLAEDDVHPDSLPELLIDWAQRPGTD